MRDEGPVKVLQIVVTMVAGIVLAVVILGERAGDHPLTGYAVHLAVGALAAIFFALTIYTHSRFAHILFGVVIGFALAAVYVYIYA